MQKAASVLRKQEAPKSAMSTTVPTTSGTVATTSGAVATTSGTVATTSGAVATTSASIGNEGSNLTTLILDMQKQITQMQKKVANLENVRIPHLENEVARLKNEVARLENEVARIPHLENEVARIPHLENEVARLENEVERIPHLENEVARIPALEQQVVILNQTVSTLKAVHLRQLIEAFRKKIVALLQAENLPVQTRTEEEEPTAAWWNQFCDYPRTLALLSQKSGVDITGAILKKTRFGGDIQEGGGSQAQSLNEHRSIYAMIVCQFRGMEREAMNSIYMVVYSRSAVDDAFEPYHVCSCSLHCPSVAS